MAQRAVELFPPCTRRRKTPLAQKSIQESTRERKRFADGYTCRKTPAREPRNSARKSPPRMKEAQNNQTRKRNKFGESLHVQENATERAAVELLPPRTKKNASRMKKRNTKKKKNARKVITAVARCLASTACFLCVCSYVMIAHRTQADMAWL